MLVILGQRLAQRQLVLELVGLGRSTEGGGRKVLGLGLVGRGSG